MYSYWVARIGTIRNYLAFRLFATPFSQQMLVYCNLEFWEPIAVQLEANTIIITKAYDYDEFENVARLTVAM